MQRTKSLLLLISIGLIALLATAMHYQVSHKSLSSAQQTIQQMPPQNTGQFPENIPEGMQKALEQGMQMPPANMGANSQAQAPQMGMSKLFGENVDPALATRAGELMQQMQTNPNNPETLVELAMLFSEAEDYKAMLNFANRASVIDPSNPQIAYLIGMAYSQLGQNENAIEAFEFSLSLEESPVSLYALALLYLYTDAIKDKDKAQKYLEQALAIPNTSPDLKEQITQELEGL